ncbi:UNVERIFIED_CONTAM: dockerin type I repeat protein [Acetivibrio alkalicellulosi]
MKKKKLFVFILLAAFILTNVFIPVFSVDLQNPDSVKISVKDERGTIGDVLKLSLELSDVPLTGICQLEFTLTYEQLELEILDISPSKIIENADENFEVSILDIGSSIVFSFEDKTKGSELIRTDGEFAQITVKIKAGAFNGPSIFHLNSIRQVNFNNADVEIYEPYFLTKALQVGEVYIENGADKLINVNIGMVSGRPGQILEVPVYVSNIAPVKELKFALKLDPSTLDLISVDPSNIISDIEGSLVYMRSFSRGEVGPDGNSITTHLACNLQYFEFYYVEHDLEMLYDIKIATITVEIKKDVNGKEFSPIEYIDLSYDGPANDEFYSTKISPKKLELQFINGGVHIEKEEKAILGDLNGDGVVNSTDSVLMRRYLLGIIDEFPVNNKMAVADLNGDGKINSNDYVLIKRIILNI